MNKAIKYLRDDLTRQYGLEEDVRFFVRGEGVADIMGGKATYTTRDGTLTIARNGADGVVVACHPFRPESNLWNGPDVLPDKMKGAMEASLSHDLIWYHADELAEAFGCTRTEILHWANGVLYAIWLGVAGPSFVSRVSYGICELVAPIYHAAKKRFLKSAFVVALGFGALAACGGCALFNAPPDWRLDSAEGLEFVAAAVTGRLDNASAAIGAETNAPSAETDAVAFGELQWRYGGFNGSKAAPVAGCVISDLSVGGGKMSYKWRQGGCELLGAADKGDTNCIAAFFVQLADGVWHGGKFEWISTSRTSRSLGNIEGGYNGWPEYIIEAAQAYAFCIVSKDGRKRSNVITVER
jgi:hypothetical protein